MFYINNVSDTCYMLHTTTRCGTKIVYRLLEEVLKITSFSYKISLMPGEPSIDKRANFCINRRHYAPDDFFLVRPVCRVFVHVLSLEDPDRKQLRVLGRINGSPRSTNYLVPKMLR
jgi:hypothetical protein